MRTQDEEKKTALFEATVKLVNEIGFASSSVSKIAKEAGVSPSTVYIYHENKQDLLISTYVQIKHHMAGELMKGYDDSLSIRDIIKQVWIRMYHYITGFPEYNMYMEQFANSPYASLVDKTKLDQHYSAMMEVIQRGIDEAIIKDVDFHFLIAFMFKPLSYLANPHLCGGEKFSEAEIGDAFSMAWDAIKI